MDALFKINEATYLKNPDSSALGRKIISGGISLIDKIGFEAFTFKKLGKEINSPEASIYRYFESKHKLLLYLTNWYWAWMEHRLEIIICKILSAEERLDQVISFLTEEAAEDNNFGYINTTELYRIVISESSKSYLIKNVDEFNDEGVFLGYKQFVSKISNMVLEINPNYKYPNMLVSTVIEGIHHQRFFATHLPRLTNNIEGESTISGFFHELVRKVIKSN